MTDANTFRLIGDAPDLRSYVKTPAHARQQWHCFTSPEALAAHVAATGAARCWHTTVWSASDDRTQFTGAPSMGAAIQWAREGWQEGADRAARLRDRINTDRPKAPRIVRYDMAGAIPSVPRCLAGNPLHMRRLDARRAQRRPLTILSDICCSYDIPADCLARRAAVVAAIVDAAEESGFSCRVIAAAMVRRDDFASITLTTVKDHAQPVDVARLAYGMGHPAMFRRLVFATFTEHRISKILGGGIGNPTAIQATDAEPVYTLAPPNEKMFATDDRAVTNGLPYLTLDLRNQGCPAFQDAD